MSNTLLIAELVSTFHTYEIERDIHSIEDFATWILQRSKSNSIGERIQIGEQDAYATQKVEEVDNAIGILLGLLNKYARHYAKVVLDDLPLNTIDEFGYLAHLSSHQQLTKSELINRNLDGKTTGTEIIKRMLRLGLMKEMDNPADKRSKLMSMTEQGNLVIAKAYAKMGMVSVEVVGNLTKEEKVMLMQLMMKLETHHRNNESQIISTLKSMTDRLSGN